VQGLQGFGTDGERLRATGAGSVPFAELLAWLKLARLSPASFSPAKGTEPVRNVVNGSCHTHD